MLIIFVSFAMLTVITAITVNTYSVNTKSELMSNAAKSSVSYIERKIKADGIVYFRTFINKNQQDLAMMLDAVAFNAGDVTIVVTDNAGNILMCTGVGAESLPEDAVIPKSLMDEVNNGKNISGFETLPGVFQTPQLVNAAPILNNNYVYGTVFCFSDSAGVSELLEVMIKTIVLASLWVMLAALLAVYFISEKVISPLKDISRAAKKFASGKFDTRVTVRGNDEVAELATAFNNMAQSLDNYETMRNNFTANVSHDLRTPMTTISGFIDGILDGAIPPEKHEYYRRRGSSAVAAGFVAAGYFQNAGRGSKICHDAV